MDFSWSAFNNSGIGTQQEALISLQHVFAQKGKLYIKI